MERAGVGVGEQPGLGEDELGHLGDVVDRRVVAAFAEPIAGDLVAVLRPFAQGEERFVAAGAGALTGDAEHVVGVEVELLDAGGRLRERAVAAGVVAQERQGDEHLRAECDPRAGGGGADRSGGRHQFLGGAVEEFVVAGLGAGSVRGHRVPCVLLVVVGDVPVWADRLAI